VKIGLQLPDFTWPGGPATLGADLATIARTADDAGFDFLAVMDHFFQIGVVGPPENDMLEAYTTLGYLAAHTKNVKLLTLVTGVVYRHPGILAKQVSTLDVLSHGRAWLGIGAAWNEEESRGLGCHSHRWRSASSGWRTRCRSCTGCSAGTRSRTRGSISRWTARSTIRRR
jgi:alkanesulfonate monooxygenase SsuD/methylene tetrahydromethanopterin reductase-like flavin-dependent oxidoreductase (luciferase family)